MNNSLLQKNDYINTINKIIQEEIMKFALPVYNINFLKSSSGNIYFKIDSDLFLELLFLRIRGETIKFASVLKKQTNNREKQLIADIESIESDENLRCIHSNLLTDKKSELRNLRESKVKGEAIRSRAQGLMKGEKPSSFFCNLERRNFVEKTIKKLQDKEGHYITAQGDILKETEKFYTKLFQNKDNDLVDIHLDKLLPKVKINKVKNCNNGSLLQVGELGQVLKKMKNNKSPGVDGISPEFLKVFWGKLKYLVTNALNACFQKGKLSTTLRQCIVTLLPKGKYR